MLENVRAMGSKWTLSHLCLNLPLRKATKGQIQGLNSGPGFNCLASSIHLEFRAHRRSDRRRLMRCYDQQGRPTPTTGETQRQTTWLNAQFQREKGKNKWREDQHWRLGEQKLMANGWRRGSRKFPQFQMEKAHKAQVWEMSQLTKWESLNAQYSLGFEQGWGGSVCAEQGRSPRRC